jgi:hypothetical protein
LYQATTPTYTNGPKHRLFGQRLAGWYLIDFARSRHTNPVRIPIGGVADRYYVTPPVSLIVVNSPR